MTVMTKKYVVGYAESRADWDRQALTAHNYTLSYTPSFSVDIMGCVISWSAVYSLLVISQMLLPVAWAKYITVDIDISRVVHDVDERYLSVAISPKLIKEDWRTFDFTSERLHTLATGLAPGFLRLGGTEADFLIFKPDSIMGSKDYINYTMSCQDWDNINKFSKAVGWRLLFDFNVLLRTGHDWDDLNAREILNYSIQKGYNDNLHFQLGNEPNAFQHAVNRSLSAKQLGHDFQKLRALLRGYPYKQHVNGSMVMGPDITNPSGHSPNITNPNGHSPDITNPNGHSPDINPNGHSPNITNPNGHSPFSHSLLVGPDVTRPENVGEYRPQLWVESTEYLKEYLSAVNHTIDAVSWHQYYFDGETAQIANFLNASTMDVLAKQIAAIRGVMEETGYKGSRVWLTETSSAYGGGAAGLSDRYVAGFLWMDKLGLAARLGIDLVVRQTFYAADYSLIDFDLEPLPDYWLSVIYKTLVGTRVLDVDVHDGSHNLRVYAHCTNIARSGHPAGSVTAYALNLHGDDVVMKLPSSLQAGTKLQYLLTPHGKHGLKSQYVELNGKKLQMVDDRTLPALSPQSLSPSADVTLPSNTFAFWVFPGAKAAACL